MPEAVVSTDRSMAGKLERICQLAAHGLNTPKLVRIEAGTPVDAELRDSLRTTAGTREQMTVRTYHPRDEITYAKGPFYPEVPTEEAIVLVEQLIDDWHVLFQEAIPVEATELAGNLLIDATGAGSYEVLRGPYRVREVENPPPGSETAQLRGSFTQANEIRVAGIRLAAEGVMRSGLLDEVSVADRIIVEFNVQKEPVGERGERLLFWEWRPAAPIAIKAPRVAEAREDGGVYGLGVAGFAAPAGASEAAAVLGGKGFSLARMASVGLPIPPAVIFSVPHGRVAEYVPTEWSSQIDRAVVALQQSSGRSLASVRSSPTASMPGMLDTVLGVELSAPAMRSAISTVLSSWWSERAIAYRENHGIARAGLAIIVQALVDGTRDDQSGAGVGFTRDPRTGEDELIIDYLPRRRGSDIVGGDVTPEDSAEVKANHSAVWREVADIARPLEAIFADMQEFEFTIEEGHLFLLQARPGKRSPLARVRIAFDLFREGVVDEPQARELLAGVDPHRLVTRRLSANGARPLATARVAAPGAVSGKLALSRERAAELAARDEPVVLCTETTNPADYPVIPRLAGILTQHGGVTSHAAVVALEAGIVALVGCEELAVDYVRRKAVFGESELGEGEWISLDGSNGSVYAGRVPAAADELPRGLSAQALAWATTSTSAAVAS